MRPPRLPSSPLFRAPPFTVVLAVLGSFVLLFYALSPRIIVDPASTRRAIERDVYRTLIDSVYTVPIDSGTHALREVMLTDHFQGPYMIADDSVMASYVDEWLRDSVPTLPADARADFRDRLADTSSLMAAMLPPNAAADTEPGLPFPGTRAHLHLLNDSTVAQFFSRACRRSCGWTGFRAAYPHGTGIVSLSRVGLSRDGQWAVVYAGEQSDWLAGAGFIHVLQRRGREWRIIKSRMAWVS